VDHLFIRLSVLGLVLISLFGAACDALPQSRASADSSGKLTILGSSEEVFVLGMANAFEAETGIKTTYERLSTGEALARLRAEKASPRHSVWWGGPVDNYIEASGEGLLEPYRPRGFGTLPRQFRDESGAWTGIYVGVLAFGVNTAVLEARGLTPPTSWPDLLKPQYEGLIVMGHPATSGTGSTIVATIMQLHNKNVEAGFEYFEALNRNIAQYTRSGAEAARVVGRGEAAVGIAFSHDIVDAGQISPNLRVVFPGDGTGYEIGGMALVKGAPESAEGKRFMDWAISQRAQELGPSFRAYQIPTNPDARVSPLSARLASIKTIDYDFRWAGNRHDDLVRRFQTTIAPATA
jgi:iron(III) transport system substrate-binding protein